MARFIIYPQLQVFYNGLPVDSGTITAYEKYTSNLANIYNASDVLYPNSEVLLDTYGRASIKIEDFVGYTFVIKDKNGKIIDTIHDVSPIVDPAIASITLKGGLTLSGNLQLDGGSLITSGSKKIHVTPNGSGTTQVTRANISGYLYVNRNNIIVTDTKEIRDNNGNNLIKFSKTASAVNYINITNGGANINPTLGVGGTDANVNLNFTPKGSGNLVCNNNTLPLTLPAQRSLISTNGSGTLSYNRLSIKVPTNYIGGLKLSNNSGSPLTHIDIAVGAAANNDNSGVVALETAFTKRIDQSWAAGTNNGGNGTSLSANTWYHVFLIGKTDNSSTDAGFDTSITAANLLTAASGSGYTKYRRIGGVLTNGSSQIIGFIQKGNHFLWKTPILDLNIGSPVGDTLLRPSVPPITCTAILNAVVTISEDNIAGGNGSLGTLTLIVKNGSSGATVDSVDASVQVGSPVGETDIRGKGNMDVPTNSSGQIIYTATLTQPPGNHIDVANSLLATTAWVDTRGA